MGEKKSERKTNVKEKTKRQCNLREANQKKKKEKYI